MKRRKHKKYVKTDLVERAILAEERVKALRINITKSEERVLALLEELPYEFIFQYPCFDEWYFVIADFYLPKLKLMIEVDGESHLGAAQKAKEGKRRRWLNKQGIRVLRIRNKATRKMKKQHLQERILRCVSTNIRTSNKNN